MKKIAFILALMLTTSNSYFSQVSFSVGPSLIKPFGLQGVNPGLHIGVEINDDDFLTLYGRFLYLPATKGDPSITIVSGKDFNVSPYSIEVNSYDKRSLSMLEFGKRYYFGDGYESGFGIYGGTTLSLIFNSVRTELDDYDESQYMYTGSSETNGTILGFGFGINGGLKNSFNFGTLFFDAGINYSLLQIASNSYASNYMSSDKYRTLNFVFNLGIRRDFY